MRKVRFPLKLKLLAFMLVMIASTLIVFVGIAIQTFREDKSAYIFETMLNKANSEQIILSQKLGNGSFNVKNGTLNFNERDPSGILSAELNKESVYKNKLIFPEQNNLYELNNNSLSPLSQEETRVLSAFRTTPSGVKEATIADVKYLFAYEYNPDLNYIFVVTLPQEQAFLVTKYLIKKSIYYGIFILGVSMLLSVFLARPLTAQLEKLFGMTQEIAQGNFNQRVKIQGSDEVGALSDSVNDMADKIVLYMEEMKEKARLENEVLVAKIVQSSFFPEARVNQGPLSIEGHFEPASECGGDWWGHYSSGDWTVFFIADATGHGVPAALLTATINCCKSSLQFILETRPNLLAEPNEILRYMNQAVCGAGKEIQVTCFVASFNSKTRELLFSNSSQTPPLLFKASGEKLSKDDFRPLIEANGPRLGQSPASTYQSEKLQLAPHDTIFFYTDGLTEASNSEGTSYGQRRLIKALIEQVSQAPVAVISGVVNDLKTFTNDEALKDDLTIVTMQVNA